MSLPGIIPGTSTDLFSVTKETTCTYVQGSYINIHAAAVYERTPSICFIQTPPQKQKQQQCTRLVQQQKHGGNFHGMEKSRLASDSAQATRQGVLL